MLGVDKPSPVVESVLAHALITSTLTHGLAIGNISVRFDSFNAIYLVLPLIQIEYNELYFSEVL